MMNLRNLFDQEGKWIEEFEEYDKFDMMGLPQKLLGRIYDVGYVQPTEIQQKIIKPIVYGRDVIAISPMGTGKTSAMTIGMLPRIDSTLKQIQAIILVNSGQLAVQVRKQFEEFGNYTIQCVSIIGGVKKYQLLQQLPQIIIGTPMKSLKYIQNNNVDMTQIQILAMDEMDELVSQGFSEDIINILQLLQVGVQLIQFSDVNLNACLQLTQKFLKHAIIAEVSQSQQILQGIKQLYLQFNGEEEKYQGLIKLYRTLYIKHSIIYCNNEGTVEELFDQLNHEKLSVRKLLRSMSLKAKCNILAMFKESEIKVLISDHAFQTKQFAMIINYQFPMKLDQYFMRYYIKSSIELGYKVNMESWVSVYIYQHQWKLKSCQMLKNITKHKSENYYVTYQSQNVSFDNMILLQLQIITISNLIII